jgi:hypothetical protein
MMSFRGQLLLALSVSVLSSSSAWATLCGQPISHGDKPTVTDALAILKSAVGGTECASRPCSCDVDGNNSVSASDALRVLKIAVGQAVAMNCGCSSSYACSSLQVSARLGSEFDYGWTGQAHNLPEAEGVLFTANIAHRCTNNGQRCTSEENCPGGQCMPTCDCVTDRRCEIVGPTQTQRCLYSLTRCETSVDCPNDDPCVSLFGAPVPASWAGTSVCTVTSIDGTLTGVLDVDTGEGTWSAELRRHTYWERSAMSSLRRSRSTSKSGRRVPLRGRSEPRRPVYC